MAKMPEILVSNRLIYSSNFDTNFRVKVLLDTQKTGQGFFAILGLIGSISLSACPDLAYYYDILEKDPQLAESELARVLDQCMDSSEYFSLLGAAQVGTGNLFQALENLELALLINPDNGSALVDYAEVLYRQGDVGSALELNNELLSRADLPQGLKDSLFLRQRRWGRIRIQRNLTLGGVVGYDHNLNSAPLSDQLALTLSGNSVTLEVSPEYQAQEGPYTKLVAGAGFRRVGPVISSQVSGQVRGVQEKSQHELLQASAQMFLRTSDTPWWDLVLGFDHVTYGQNTIFSSSTVMGRYIHRQSESCVIYPKVAIQYQYFHAQRLLSGVEKSLGAGADCNLRIGDSTSRFGIELSAITNQETSSGRLGDDREGWRLNLVWRQQLGIGQILAQFVRTGLNDKEGYSPIFDSGEKRQETLSSSFIQYSRPFAGFGPTAQFYANLSYHGQNSTIDLFKTRGFAAEVGINWGF